MTKFSAPFFIDIAGEVLSREDEILLLHPLVGGVIFFARNYHSKAQLTALVSSIRALNPNLLLAVDQEGGRVQRFKNDFTLIPPMAELGKLYLKDKASALEQAIELAVILASELKAVDIDISFAPVLDINRGLSEVVGDRAFSDNPQTVIALARAVLIGFKRAGILAVGKHFPGHGGVTIDSHIDIPIDQRDLNELAHSDLLPFAALIKSGLEALMPAHIIFPQIDSLPACFSQRWLTDILRGNYRFKGLIFSDDMSMEGAKVVGDLYTRTRLAMDAGCDFVLIRNDRPGVVSLLQQYDTACEHKPVNIMV